MATKDIAVSDKLIPLFSVNIPPDIDKPLLEVLHSGYIGQGKKVEEFESLLSMYFDTKNILTVNSGTSALTLAMRLAGVEDGVEVISTPMTCFATNAPILANNGTIVWADVDPNTGLIDPKDVERKITPKTKLIVATDWGGTPCDWDELNRIAKKYGIKTLEDAAHAFGATHKGRKVGTLADYTIFSLQAIKHITTIDGGILICRDSADYRKGKLLRWYGIDRETEKRDSRIEEDIPDWGYKFHMNDINATIGIVQMGRVNDIIERHRAIAYDYFRIIDQKNFFSTMPSNGDYKFYQSSYWLFTVRLANELLREDFINFMKESNIMVSQVHRRNDTHSTVAKFTKNLPGVDEFTQHMICLPINYAMTDDDVKRVIKSCELFVQQK